MPSMGAGSCGQVTTSSSESLSLLSFISDSLLDPSSVIELWQVSISRLANRVLLCLVILAAGIVLNVALLKVATCGNRLLALVETKSGLVFFGDGSGMVDATFELPSRTGGGVHLFLV